MPGQVIDFTRRSLSPTDLSLIRLNLPRGMSLMLWAGDCVHQGISDVKRLKHYQVFLCRGFPEGLAANTLSLRTGQVLCILDVDDEQQMSAFRYVFRERFRYINSDYHGNTPSLPLCDYSALLEPDGIARHVFGINGLIMPYEDYYRVLETFAPVLSAEWKDRRNWSREVLELAARDSLSPGMVWTDDVVKTHPHYAYVLEAQKRFVSEGRKRNPQWPHVSASLEEHWDSLPLSTLSMPSYMHLPSGRELMLLVEPYLPALSAHLSRRMQGLPQFHMLRPESLEEKSSTMTPLEAIREKQRIIGILSTAIPPDLAGQVDYFTDDRKEGRLLDLTLRKIEPASS